MNKILHEFSTSFTLFQMNEPIFDSRCKQIKRVAHTKFETSDGGARYADGEACYFTAYWLRLLIKVGEDDVRYWEKWRKKVEKVTREENVHLCLAELLHNAIKRPTHIQRKHSSLSEKHISPENMRGWKEFQLPSEG